MTVTAGTLLPGDAVAAKKQLTVQDMYELGLRYMKRGYYVKALEQFNRVRNYHRDDPYAVKAELAIADVYYQKNEWDQARLATRTSCGCTPPRGPGLRRLPDGAQPVQEGAQGVGS